MTTQKCWWIILIVWGMDRNALSCYQPGRKRRPAEIYIYIYIYICVCVCVCVCVSEIGLWSVWLDHIQFGTLLFNLDRDCLWNAFYLRLLSHWLHLNWPHSLNVKDNKRLTELFWLFSNQTLISSDIISIRNKFCVSLYGHIPSSLQNIQPFCPLIRQFNLSIYNLVLCW
jgi:hypothetical protein